MPDPSAPQASEWKVVAASVRGSSHEKTGQPCQDAHAWLALPGPALVAAVADGAGSAPLAEVGAELAVRVAVDYVSRHAGAQDWPANDAGWRSLVGAALGKAREALLIEAAARGASPSDLATTLIILVAARGTVAAAQIGDGATVLGDREGNLLALTTPRSGEYINETTFLVSPGAVDEAQVVVWHGDAAHLAAVSDGLQMLALKMPEGSPHPPFFAGLFQFAAAANDAGAARGELEAFLGSPKVLERTDDDLTLLLATIE